MGCAVVERLTTALVRVTAIFASACVALALACATAPAAQVGGKFQICHVFVIVLETSRRR